MNQQVNVQKRKLYKFYYILISLCFLPLTTILFIIKHLKKIFIILVISAIIAIYIPYHNGSDLKNIFTWYANKSDNLKVELVDKATEDDWLNLVPDSIINDAQDVKRNEYVRLKDNIIEKGKDYNKKINRDENIEDATLNLKTRGGFKKKGKFDNRRLKDDTSMLAEEIIIESNNETTENTEIEHVIKAKSVGLGAFIKQDKLSKEQPEDTEAKKENIDNYSLEEPKEAEDTKEDIDIELF